MAIKKLQNNFTTPEQSKRLLELGVPADSADCYLNLATNGRGIIPINGIYSKDIPINIVCEDGSPRYYPCWSVGRLIEIMGLCYPFEMSSCASIQVYRTDIEQGCVLDQLISDIERFMNKTDFSKLEE